MLDTSRVTGENLHQYLRNVDVQWGRINFEDLPQMDIAPTEVARYTVQAGDLLVCEGGEVGRAAVVEVVEGVTAFQKALHRLRPIHSDEVSKYMFYVLRWAADSGAFSTNGQSTIAHLTGEQLRKYRFPCPPGGEQVTIAAFLDRETAKIDALIAEQKKLVALLAEKRQATISRTVTRGLNPNASMKDSGVAWLGEVPAHWEVTRVKRVVSTIEQGWSPQCENFPVEGPEEWGVLKVGCVNGGTFDHTENKKLPAELVPLPEFALKKGDLLISRANTRELVGGAAVVQADFDRLLLCDKLYRLRLTPDECLPDFAAAFLGTREARSQIELDATGASNSMLNIGQSIVLELRLPLPNLDEQTEIIEFLQAESNRFDALSVNSQRAIVLLKERRSALIAAAVTGQIDVRGAVAVEANP
ncbi:restriction endonuclease subunit S [Variovorax sp. GB1P17]|uniref:restriction endonuclease subunit S n=1 Tax=Variovorax sp. GB1P17 TaxID=3443740 RepID=UPI003F4650B2